MALGATARTDRATLTDPARDLTVARAAAGDADAFRVLYQGHVGRVHAVCLRLVADALTAEELTQEVFVQAWRGLASFRGDSSFGTWLHRLAVNVTLMHLRAARRRDRRLPLWADPPDAPVPGHHDPGQRMDLERAIASLPEGCRTVFVQAWRGLASFRGDSSFGTWLHRLAVNVTLMHLRAARRREQRLPLWADPPDAPHPRHHDPGQRMDLERAIASLPEGCRTVFVLHDVEGWRHEEIAERLQLAVGTCKAHLFRARRLLREKLA